ncbi:DUF2061 domain-containing protein [Desulfuromonas acetexigens]|jgi:uncharacterized membrane protein|uniref:DUF2061 domain-containing protein n=1 Tax=Trichloromonas acetexigens TaxID=38815 RepID=A0A550JJ84_9BACT|nr:DUF2061 domain-containing protein [Desulfuromonas acetexigens]TRO83233.1 DUF2061 domain-containing protein [Desulfuromonas acetexigens]
MESTRRSIAKAVSYRIIGTLTTAGVVFVAIGRLDLAATVGVLDTFFKIFVYVGHERMWNRIPYGRETKQPEYFI